MRKTNLMFVLIAMCLTIAACSTTNYNIVDPSYNIADPSQSNSEQIIAEIISANKLWEKTADGQYKNKDGSEIIITEENYWEEIIRTLDKMFKYPITEYYSHEYKILIPKNQLDKLPQNILDRVEYAESRAIIFRILNEIAVDDISFIGVLQIYEHMSIAYEVKKGIAYLYGRADEPIVWNGPVPGTFERGKKLNQSVIIEK